MKNKYPHKLILTFFGNNLPEELQYKFQKWFIESNSRQEKEEAMLDIWENITASSDISTEAELKKIKKRIATHGTDKRRSLYTRIGWVAAIILLPILSALVTHSFKKESVLVIEPELVEHFVPYTEREKVVLPDSSEVWLNAGSLLVYAKNFEGENRTVFLDGEANFTVTKNTEKPFIVKTVEMDIEVLGTVFNVESYADREYCITTLERGKVKINAKRTDAESIFLSPNEQLIYNKASKTFEKKKVLAERSGRWKDGYMIFQGTSFDYMMETIQRRFGIKINYRQDKFAGRTFTIRFTPEEDINQVFSILKDVCGFKYTRKDSIIYIN